MSSLTGLTQRQVQVMWAVGALEEKRLDATGPAILAVFENSDVVQQPKVGVEGLHTTAASLIRRKVFTKELVGSRTASYRLTEYGGWLLRREVRVHGAML